MVLVEFRKRLRSMVRGEWAKPEMMAAQTALSDQAKAIGFANCIKEHMKAGTAGKNTYADCAETTKLADAYKGVWGKK